MIHMLKVTSTTILVVFLLNVILIASCKDNSKKEIEYLFKHPEYAKYDISLVSHVPDSLKKDYNNFILKSLTAIYSSNRTDKNADRVIYNLRKLANEIYEVEENALYIIYDVRGNKVIKEIPYSKLNKEQVIIFNILMTEDSTTFYK